MAILAGLALLVPDVREQPEGLVHVGRVRRGGDAEQIPVQVGQLPADGGGPRGALHVGLHEDLQLGELVASLVRPNDRLNIVVSFGGNG